MIHGAGAEVVGTVWLVPIAARAFAITTPRLLDAEKRMDEVELDLIAEALSQAVLRGAERVHVRIVDLGKAPRLTEGMSRMGFVQGHRRIEYETPVALLPEANGTPLVWHPLGSAACSSRAAAAGILTRVVRNDPGWDTEEDPREALEGFLAEPDLLGDDHCVQVATAEGAGTIGIVIAQTTPTTGWSRITYLGLVPEARGRGYGQWLHRHGFAMLKAQGATTYHAGTSAANAPMRALFRRHGCVQKRVLTEWVYRDEGATRAPDPWMSDPPRDDLVSRTWRRDPRKGRNR